jgi:amidase
MPSSERDLELCYMPAMKLTGEIKNRNISPVEVMEATFRRIKEVNPVINVYCTLAEETAMLKAKHAELMVMKEPETGSFYGLPLGVKDLAPTAGIRTTFASHMFANNVPKEDATHVLKVLQAGGIIVGKTTTPEFGAGANTFSDLFGITRNPWDTRMTTAGSSGGSAGALAAGLCHIAVGSDLGGSLRTPASFCNVVGLRPSPGRISNYPSQLLWSPLGVTGPMARNVTDIAWLFSVMVGRDERDPLTLDSNPYELIEAIQRPDIKGWRVAWSADLGFAPMDKEVAAICERAVHVFADELGCQLETAHPDLSGVEDIFQTLRAGNMAATLGDQLPKWRDKMQKNLVWNIEKGLALTAVDMGKAEIARGQLWQRVNRWFNDYDLLITPAAAMPPFPAETVSPPEVGGRVMENYVEWLGITYGITMSGLPAIVVPCGFNKDNLPVGLQIVSKYLNEAKILKAAAAFEQARPFDKGIPKPF